MKDKQTITKPYVRSFQVTDGNQYARRVNDPKGNYMCTYRQLCRVGYGSREFVYFRLEFNDSTMKYYIEEQTPSGKFEQIQDDDLWMDLAHFIDDYQAKIKPDGSDV